MDRLGLMTVFARVVDAGSLSGAARALGRSLPAVSRAIAQLEHALGARLLNRTTRKLSPTEAGTQYYEHCKRILLEVDEAEAVVSARQVAPSGALTVNAPVIFGRMHVAPLVGKFLTRYPMIAVNLILTDRFVDLIEEGTDLALRVGNLPDSSLVATPLGTIRQVLCAAPAYLARRGTPRSPADLRQHNCLQFSVLARGSGWTFRERNSEKTVRVLGNYASNNGDAVIAAAVSGLGIARVLSYQIQPHVARGEVVPLLEAHEPAPLALQAVYSSHRLLPARVRAFLDFLGAELRHRDFATLAPPGRRAKRKRRI